MSKLSAAVLITALLVSCTNPLLDDKPDQDPLPPNSQLPEVPNLPLPEEVETRVRTAYAGRQRLLPEQVSILRFTPELWSDGCLGLGGPAESCLLALTEGWQVEAADQSGQNNQFYRTDATGEQVRLSTLENNLPPSVGNRIVQTLRASGMADGDELSIVPADTQVWDGCYGLAAEGEACTKIAILRWRAIATDMQSYWVYHTDNLGNVILLNEALSGTQSIPVFE